jgi:hypothetical protein
MAFLATSVGHPDFDEHSRREYGGRQGDKLELSDVLGPGRAGQIEDEIHAEISVASDDRRRPPP